MLKNKLDSEAGFGIVAVLATLVIASVAIAGLFVTSYYVRSKATENYHTRIALLKAAEALDKIKWFNRSETGPVDIQNLTGLAQVFTMDERGGNRLMATVHNPTVVYSQLDLNVAPYCVYDKVTVEVTWIEGSRNTYGAGNSKECSVVLREDYFRQLQVGGE